MLLFVATIFHARSLPFALWELTVLEFVSLFVSSFTFFLGQFTIEAGDYGTSFQATASIMALLINVGFLCFAMWIFAHLKKEKPSSQILEDPSGVEMMVLPEDALVCDIFFLFFFCVVHLYR